MMLNAPLSPRETPEHSIRKTLFDESGSGEKDDFNRGWFQSLEGAA